MTLPMHLTRVNGPIFAVYSRCLLPYLPVPIFNRTRQCFLIIYPFCPVHPGDASALPLALNPQIGFPVPDPVCRSAPAFPDKHRFFLAHSTYPLDIRMNPTTMAAIIPMGISHSSRIYRKASNRLTFRTSILLSSSSFMQEGQTWVPSGTG